VTDERFELIERLGSGGMATVWRARDRRLQREIALKRPLPHLARDAEAVARFEREARAAAALNHPNVVTVYDAGEDGEGPWLAMELVHGVSLRHVLDRGGPLPSEQTADYVRQAAAGLDAAHECGLIHRDIKPQNLMVGDDGRVRLTDFGLARPVTQETPVTAEGTVLGSVRYLAPEALEGRQGPSADIYSLAAVAYEMLTGRPPFDAPTTGELLDRIRTAPPTPPSRLHPDAAGYDAVFASALSKDPADRPATAGAFAAELADAAGATVPMPAAAVAEPPPAAADTTLLMVPAPPVRRDAACRSP
jgi:eukaryotic-like serine/threonine-protein kinase